MSVQFYGYKFGGTGVFHFSPLAVMHSFQKLAPDFGDFQTPCVKRDSHRESTACKLVCEMNRGIHCKSGSSCMGLAVNAGISIWNEECSAIPHTEICYVLPKFDYHS